MPRIEKTKKHLLVKRFKIIKFLISEGYSGADIAIIFNIDKSVVSRIIQAGEKYKISVKNMLKD